MGDVGDPAVCDDVLLVSWEACGQDLTPASAAGPIDVDIPLPSAIVGFAATDATITCPGDAAALEPIALPSSTSLSAEVLFPDGASMRIMDERASLELASGSPAGCTLQHDTAAGTVTVASTDSPCAAAQCIVVLTYPTLNASLAAQAIVSVVAVEQVTVSSQAYNASASCTQAARAAAPAAQTLRSLACSPTDYQQVSLCALALLSATADDPAGQSIDVTAQAAFASSDDSTVTLLPNIVTAVVINRVRPLAPGTAGVTAIFGGVTSASLAVTAADAGAAVTVDAFELMWSGSSASTGNSECTGLCDATFAAIAGTTAALTMTLTLSDGYTYDPATLLGTEFAALDILDVSAIFSFASSLPAAISAGAYGDARLLQNAADAVTLEAETTCTSDSSAMASETELFANLLPASLDVDVGLTFGPALQQLGANGTTASPVQVCLFDCVTRHYLPAAGLSS